MKFRDVLEFGICLVLFFLVLWLLFAGAGYFFDCGLTAEEQAGLIPLANGGWGR